MSVNKVFFNGPGGLIIPVLATDPSSPVEGEMWFNSTTGVAKIYDGSVIKAVFNTTEISDYSIVTIDNSDSPYNLTAGVDVVLVDTSSGPVQINVDAAASIDGKRFRIKKISNDGEIITIEPDGSETIDGEANYDLWMPLDVLEIVSDGSNLQILNKSIKRPEAVAWVNSSAQTVNNSVTGTYVRTGTEVVVTSTAHGHRVGHKVRFDATSGSATDGLFNITAVTANTFTFTHGTSGNTSGDCNLPRLEIYNSKNIHSVVPAANTQSSDNHVNLSIDLPDVNYSVQGTSRNAGVSGNDNGTTPVRFVGETEVSTQRTVNSFKTTGATTSAGSSDHQINMIVFY